MAAVEEKPAKSSGPGIAQEQALGPGRLWTAVSEVMATAVGSQAGIGEGVRISNMDGGRGRLIPERLGVVHLQTIVTSEG